ncbi:putative carbbohydrate responsive phospholipase [Haloterrigena salina JCM 13891]|uniref:Putative carbbohydrate responsive phospholipase n=1 Tax=Haloterrigena salina JCM 13891 TaxID=1227488 RepID=M0BWA9_9EURY|nr:putative carbbohydrate responsive phospholipase [Haloterrigena salina JCM 13891]
MAGTDDGADIVQQSWTGADGQRWFAVALAGDRYGFVNANSGHVLDAEDSGENVVQCHWTSGANHRWELADRSSDDSSPSVGHSQTTDSRGGLAERGRRPREPARREGRTPCHQESDVYRGLTDASIDCVIVGSDDSPANNDKC